MIKYLIFFSALILTLLFLLVISGKIKLPSFKKRNRPVNPPPNQPQNHDEHHNEHHEEPHNDPPPEHHEENQNHGNDHGHGHGDEHGSEKLTFWDYIWRFIVTIIVLAIAAALIFGGMFLYGKYKNWQKPKEKTVHTMIYVISPSNNKAIYLHPGWKTTLVEENIFIQTPDGNIIDDGPKIVNHLPYQKEGWYKFRSQRKLSKVIIEDVY